MNSLDNPADVKDPKPNLFEVNKEYAITINPDDAMQAYREADNNRYKTVVSNMKKLLRNVSFHYTLYPEFSNPWQNKNKEYHNTNKPRLHYHGLIKFRSPIELLQWYNRHYFELSAKTSFDIKPLTDKKKWLKYCKKNAVLMKSFAKYYPTEYTLKQIEYELDD